MLQLQFPEYTIKCKNKQNNDKKGSKEVHTQVQLRPPTRADELPFVDARYCKSLNSSFASVEELTASKKTKTMKYS